MTDLMDTEEIIPSLSDRYALVRKYSNIPPNPKHKDQYNDDNNPSFDYLFRVYMHDIHLKISKFFYKREFKAFFNASEKSSIDFDFIDRLNKISKILGLAQQLDPIERQKRIKSLLYTKGNIYYTKNSKLIEKMIKEGQITRPPKKKNTED